MTYAQAIAHLHALSPELAPSADPSVPKRRFDLAEMRRLCAALGDPQNLIPAVLIGGTNGKGSTAATLASILTAAGYRAGLYTSPHLSRVNERIQLGQPVFPTEYGASASAGARPGADGLICLRQIADSRFADLYTEVDHAGQALVRSGALPQLPSFFERLTAVAFLYYAQAQADIMVLEVGLGGRLDATNVVEPILSVLTDISLDHQEYLGNTISAITAEKCGILRENGMLVTLPQHGEANQAIGEAAMRLGVRGINAADYLPQASRSQGRMATPVAPALSPVKTGSGQLPPRDGLPSLDSRSRQAGGVTMLASNDYSVSLGASGSIDIHSPLRGEHQRRNLALAIAAAVTLRPESRRVEAIGLRGFEISNSAIADGIAKTQWPGRLEIISPNLLLDVAHNPAGAWTLRSALATLPEEQSRTLIFSCLRDKDLNEMARILFPLFDSASSDPLRSNDHIILAPINSPRAAHVKDLLQAAQELKVPAHAAPHLAGALLQARQVTPAGGLIVATGSVYLVGEVREMAMSTGHTS